MGSVKDMLTKKEATIMVPGIFDFLFSDRYSIRDWGKMPDLIILKGNSLAVMGAYNFEGLEDIGIQTHYLGLVDSNDNIIKVSDLKDGGNGSNIMRVEKAFVHHPEEIKTTDEKGKEKVGYDYSFFENNRGNLNNFLVPLEVIYRNGLPLGSSVFKRIKEAKAKEDAAEREKALDGIYSKLGLTSEPKPRDMLPKPIINFTTKLEAGDRSLKEEEAYKISGLSKEEFDKIIPLTLKINEFITEVAKKAGMDHYDGKVEFVYFISLKPADVAGTLDECRFGYNGEQVSKEFLRQWYDKNQPEFAPACEKWKETGEGWQERCDVKPIHLPKELSTLVSQMYMAGCNKYVGRNIFDASPLAEVMDNIRPYR